MEARRSDVILLVGAVVMIAELKGKTHPSQGDVDQVAAYARDLRCYHRECADRPVVPVLVPTRASGYLQSMDGVHIVGPGALDALVSRLAGEHPEPLVDRARFLAESAYRPLPTLVEAARELFASGEVRAIHRARRDLPGRGRDLAHRPPGGVHAVAAPRARDRGARGGEDAGGAADRARAVPRRFGGSARRR